MTLDILLTFLLSEFLQNISRCKKIQSNHFVVILEFLLRAPDGRLLRGCEGVRQLRLHVDPFVEERRDR